MKIFLIGACIFTAVNIFLTAIAAVFAAFWSVSNISYFGIAGDYATFGLLAAITGMATSLVATIVSGVAILSKSTRRTLPTVGLIFVITTLVIAVTVMVLSPLWVTGDIVNYGIVSTMPAAGAVLGGSVAVMSIIALVMLVVDRVVKPSAESA